MSFAERDEIAILKAGGCGGAMPRLKAAGATPQDGQARVQPGQYVQDRLAGVIATPDGAPVPGPRVRWVGRRQDRRWATSWSPEQIANRLPVDFPDDDLARGDL